MSRQGTVSERVTQDLVQRLGRQALFDVAANSLQGALPFDMLGLARIGRGDSTWELCAHVDRRRNTMQAPEDRFAFAGTVGAWVVSRGAPFVGSSRRQVRRFPHTYASLLREGMESNAVIPVHSDRDERLVLYGLARREGAFRDQLRDGYQHAVQQLAPLFAGCVSQPTPSVDPVESIDETLDGVQARHIRNVLERCDGVVEGKRGAASALGIKPSTLRHRMQRLGITRP